MLERNTFAATLSGERAETFSRIRVEGFREELLRDLVGMPERVPPVASVVREDRYGVSASIPTA